MSTNGLIDNMAHEPTAEELETRQARRAARQAVKAAVAEEQVEEEEARSKYLQREWIDVRNEESRSSRYLSVVSWNILAQTLIRRELYPGSDCLKWSERRPMLFAELESYGIVDIICLQECDRREELAIALPDHSYVEAYGRGKQHGLVIFYRSSRFRVRSSRVVHLDEEELSPAEVSVSDSNSNGHDTTSLRKCRGGSRITKNIALIVALDELAHPGEGVVITTTHLFWHPKFSYERLRQTIVIIRAMERFKTEHDCLAWPTVFTGDFNTTPCESTYQILVNSFVTLPKEMISEFEESRLVHSSVDALYPPAVPENGHVTNDDNADPKNGHRDDAEKPKNDSTQNERDEKLVAGSRLPREEDGILSLSEMIATLREPSYTVPRKRRSAYEEGLWTLNSSECFGERGGFQTKFEPGATPHTLMGRREPGYTCYTALFKLTLDYLLISPGLKVAGLLEPASAEDLGDGLPKEGICASDHLAVGCVLEWST